VAYDETLAARIREVIGGIDGEVTERKMFGGLAFMLNGHMFTGVVGGELMLRLGDAGAAAALRREHVREMDFTGRPMKAMVFVEPAGLDGDALGEWVTNAAAFAQSLPLKSRRTGRRSYTARPSALIRVWPCRHDGHVNEGSSEFAVELSDAQNIRF
jgi:TfoX/Sxy family transcriptional regulator of competence genes